MQEKREVFLSYLSEQKAECLEQAAILMQDDRSDEAVFFKAKGNIYDVFITLFTVSEKMAGGDAEKRSEVFLKKADEVPASWRKSLALAREHDDVAKALMEETKLSAADDIVAKYGELFMQENELTRQELR